MPTRRDFLLGSAALVTTAYAGAQDVPKSKQRSPIPDQDFLRELIPESLLRDKCPGLSLALVRDHEIVWTEAFGVRDLEIHDKLTPDTVFEAASFSKPAYSYAVLKLVEQGKMSLEKPLIEYLGRDLNPDEPRFKQITARHVLTHTSGIDSAVSAGPPKLEFTPGERFRYSPHAFDVLQKAVDRAVGETMTPMMERLVFKPFGMTRSTTEWSEEFAKSGARAYDAQGTHKRTFNEKVWRMSPEERAKFLEPYPLESVPAAAAGLQCTPADYARFMIEAMRASSDGSHLSQKMLDDMLTSHVRVEEVKSNDVFWGYGFGLQCPPAAPKSFWHTGDWGGFFQNYAVGYRDEGTALVLMTNGPGAKICREVAEVALNREQPAFKWWLGG
jgi:CubicO group peptidase (beta-lactamase class C family)